LSVFHLLGRLLRMPAETQCPLRWRGAALAALDAAKAARAGELLTEAGGFGDLFTGADPSPWAEAALEDGTAVQRALDLVASLLNERLLAARSAPAALPGLRPPANLAELRALAALLAELAETAVDGSMNMYQKR